ncbi:MAG: UbiA prenyltransferase family protein [Planctomycetota bacterium]
MGYLRLLRAHHWVKNLFVLLPIPFAFASEVQFDPASLWIGLFAFCLLNSGVYALNDVVDKERDQHHPLKKTRPVASGAVKRSSALLVSLFLVVTSLILLATREVLPGAFSIGVSYLGLNILYSFWARSIPIVDVLFLGSFFFLRILLGCFLVGADPSSFLLMGGTTIALLLAVGKRKSELQLLLTEQHRASLGWYTERGLSISIRVLAIISAGIYTYYCTVSDLFMVDRWWWSLPPVYLGIFLYQRRLLVLGDSRSPVEMLLGSPVIQSLILIWGAVVCLGIGLL